MLRKLTLALAAALILAAIPSFAADFKQPVFKKPGTHAVAPLPFRPLAEIAEVEPNDDAAQAQALACGNSLHPAALVNAGAVPDSDWVEFTANAGELITFETAPGDDPMPFTDTIVNLIAADGVTSLASDDDGASEPFFSRITDFQAPYTGTYYARVRGFDGSQGPYRANLFCAPAPPPPANDRCDGAIALAHGAVDVSGWTQYATNDYDLCPGLPECPASCTGFHSPGRDIVFRFDVNANEIIDVTYTLEPAATDAALYLVTDCSDVQGSCIAGQDAAEGAPDEHLFHRFTTGGTYYLILDAFTGGGASWVLRGCLGCPTAIQSARTWGKLKIMYR